jgi:hypothetical protein
MTVFSIDVEVYNTHVEFTFASREELLELAEDLSVEENVNFIGREVGKKNRSGYYSKIEIPNHGFLIGIVSDGLGKSSKEATTAHYVYNVEEAILKSRGLKRDPKNISYLIEYIMNKIVFSELE